MRAHTKSSRNMDGAFHSRRLFNLELSRVDTSNELEVVWWRLGRFTARSLPLFEVRNWVSYELCALYLQMPHRGSFELTSCHVNGPRYRGTW